MILVFIVILTISYSYAQNENCPLCSLGYPPPPHLLNQPNTIENKPQTMFIPTSFGSYPTNLPQQSPDSQIPKTSIFGGNAHSFGTELGKAIAQRIQQIYSSPSMQQYASQLPHPQQIQMPSSFHSYNNEQNHSPRSHPPEPVPITFNPPHHPYTGQLMNTFPGMIPSGNQLPEQMNYRNIIDQPPLQKSCPYCFPNQMYPPMSSSRKKS